MYNNTTYYYILNVQGDVIRLVDSSGTTVASYVYDPYGNMVSATGAMAQKNPLRYRGYYYDQETGFYYLNARYYDPKIGRFLNADSYVSTGQGTIGYNMFAYCLNNPVNHVDYEGTDATALLWWTESMWWFCGADLMLPVGELIYFGGMAVLGIAALDMVDEVTVPQILLENPNTSEEGEVTSGVPPTEQDGYRAPKEGPHKGKLKDGKSGWVDKNGNIWVPAPTGSSIAHGGGHWDVQRGDGKGYVNVYPGGTIRAGRGKVPKIPSIRK